MPNGELAERRGRVDERLSEADETIVDHEERITRLEKFMWITVGALAALSTVVGSAELSTYIGLF